MATRLMKRKDNKHRDLRLKNACTSIVTLASVSRVNNHCVSPFYTSHFMLPGGKARNASVSTGSF